MSVPVLLYLLPPDSAGVLLLDPGRKVTWNRLPPNQRQPVRVPGTGEQRGLGGQGEPGVYTLEKILRFVSTHTALQDQALQGMQGLHRQIRPSLLLDWLLRGRAEFEDIFHHARVPTGFIRVDHVHFPDWAEFQLR